jgi:hypothetical protein
MQRGQFFTLVVAYPIGVYTPSVIECRFAGASRANACSTLMIMSALEPRNREGRDQREHERILAGLREANEVLNAWKQILACSTRVEAAPSASQIHAESARISRPRALPD